MRWILLLSLACCGGLAGQSLGFNRLPATRALFAQPEAVEPAPEAPKTRFEQIEEASRWRGIEIENYAGLVAAKRSMVSLGVGFGFRADRSLSVIFRLDFNNDIGQARDFRPQVRALTFEFAVRHHHDFSEHVAFYGTHGLNFAAQLAYFQLDETLHGTDLGTVTSLGAGTNNFFGLEFGNRTWRGFAETGLRLQYFFLQNSDEEAVEGYEDDIQKGFFAQWVVARLGIRVYF
jgi:hypothetical protein